MKNSLLLLLTILAFNFGFTQQTQITKEHILKNGTVLTYVSAKLYKSINIEHPIKERNKKDTIKFYIKKVDGILKVFKDSLNSVGLIINKGDASIFKGILDFDFKKTSKKYSILLNNSQFNKDSLFVDEGTLYPKKYKKVPKNISVSFLFNGEKIVQSAIVYTEKVNPLDIAFSYAFLKNKEFPIQVHQNFADKSYIFAMTFRLANIETTD